MKLPFIEKVKFRKNDRIMLGLTTNGCKWASSNGGGCYHCDLFQSSLLREDNSQEFIVNQFNCAYEKTSFNNADRLEIFVSGSFYDDDEVAPETQDYILSKLAKLEKIDNILVESRPEFITKEKITQSLNKLLDKKLFISLALETSNDKIRQKCINKGFHFSDFKKAAKIIASSGAHLQVYVLLKPPFLSEREAIDDAVNTIKDILEFSDKLKISPIIALEPIFVLKNTLVDKLYQKGEYQPPWLWSVIEVLKRAYHLNNSINLNIYVGGTADVVTPYAIRENKTNDGNICTCSAKIENLIENFNCSRNIRTFDRYPCCLCKKEWEKIVSN